MWGTRKSRPVWTYLSRKWGSGGRKAPGEEFGMKSLEGSCKRLLKEVKHVQPFRMKRRKEAK